MNNVIQTDRFDRKRAAIEAERELQEFREEFESGLSAYYKLKFEINGCIDTPKQSKIKAFVMPKYWVECVISMLCAVCVIGYGVMFHRLSMS